MNEILTVYGESAKTALGFFWKSGWAFILGYALSACIQAFVPKKRLTEKMGNSGVRSVSLSALFGSVSSSCSFAALATARSLFKKGASFVSTVAFMFASTNLVIELGILIFIFLGWEFPVAEVLGGLLLILISSVIIRLTYPKTWIESAREKTQKGPEEKDFNRKKRIRSREGWYRVGSKFVMEWKMAYEDILIGFTVAGFVAVLVPAEFWEMIFLNHLRGELPDILIQAENALVAPFVAAATFIGSMGNIPLAAVLSQNGVLFAGIMGFIYSDLMVPPLVNMNKKYYGLKPALYIAGVMYVSIVLTALILNYSFEAAGVLPEASAKITETTQFAIDYTFWFNIFFAALSGLLIFLHQKRKKQKSQKHDHEPHDDKHHHEHEHNGHEHHESGAFKKGIVYFCIALLTGGIITYFAV